MPNQRPETTHGAGAPSRAHVFAFSRFSFSYRRAMNSDGHKLSQVDRARTLTALHAAPEILRLVNVWDVVSAKAVLAVPDTKALATAGHSIAASFGFDDGSTPFQFTLDLVERIVEVAGDVPVSA